LTWLSDFRFDDATLEGVRGDIEPIEQGNGTVLASFASDPGASSGLDTLGGLAASDDAPALPEITFGVPNAVGEMQVNSNGRGFVIGHWVAQQRDAKQISVSRSIRFVLSVRVKMFRRLVMREVLPPPLLKGYNLGPKCQVLSWDLTRSCLTQAAQAAGRRQVIGRYADAVPSFSFAASSRPAANIAQRAIIAPQVAMEVPRSWGMKVRNSNIIGLSAEDDEGEEGENGGPL